MAKYINFCRRTIFIINLQAKHPEMNADINPTTIGTIPNALTTSPLNISTSTILSISSPKVSILNETDRTDGINSLFLPTLPTIGCLF